MNQSHLIIPLEQGAAYVRNAAYQRYLRMINKGFMSGKMHAEAFKFDHVPFIETVLEEIFDDQSNTPMRPAGWLSPSVQALVNIGFDKHDAHVLARETLDLIIGEITLVSPTLNFAEIEEWEWGVIEPCSLMITKTN